MGNAVAVKSNKHASTSRGSSEDVQSIMQRSLHSSFTSLFKKSGRSERTITHKLSRICSDSWDKIMAQLTVDSRGLHVPGVALFASTYFTELREIDEDNRVLQKLQIRNKAKKFHYERLVLISILEFIISVHDETFDTKARIRALGRSHARHGIRYPEFRIFNEAIIRTIIRRLDPGYLSVYGVIECWTILLDFVTEQLVIDKVKFVKHHTESHTGVADQSQSVADESQQCVADPSMYARMSTSEVISLDANMDCPSAAVSVAVAAAAAEGTGAGAIVEVQADMDMKIDVQAEVLERLLLEDEKSPSPLTKGGTAYFNASIYSNCNTSLSADIRSREFGDSQVEILSDGAHHIHSSSSSLHINTSIKIKYLEGQHGRSGSGSEGVVGEK